MFRLFDSRLNLKVNHLIIKIDILHWSEGKIPVCHNPWIRTVIVSQCWPCRYYLASSHFIVAGFEQEHWTRTLYLNQNFDMTHFVVLQSKLLSFLCRCVVCHCRCCSWIRTLNQYVVIESKYWHCPSRCPSIKTLFLPLSFYLNQKWWHSNPKSR